MPERRPRQFALQEGGKSEAIELIIEGTDRRRQRPQSPKKQALHYSGKHKAHSDKKVVVVHAKTKRVEYLSQTYAGKPTTKRLPIKKRSVIPATPSCLRTPAFRAMNRRWAKPDSRKKALQRALIEAREAAQAGALAYPGESRTCAGGREARADCERHTAQHPREFLRFSNGCGLWFTQLACPGTQAPLENLTQPYFG